MKKSINQSHRTSHQEFKTSQPPCPSEINPQGHQLSTPATRKALLQVACPLQRHCAACLAQGCQEHVPRNLAVMGTLCMFARHGGCRRPCLCRIVNAQYLVLKNCWHLQIQEPLDSPTLPSLIFPSLLIGNSTLQASKKWFPATTITKKKKKKVVSRLVLCGSMG